MVNKMKILPLDHFLLVMQKLAHFHGRWLTFRWMGEAGSLPQVTPPLSRVFLAPWYSGWFSTMAFHSVNV
jgi:hypothetical protein